MIKALLILLMTISLAHSAEVDTSSKLKKTLSKHLGEITQVNKSPIKGLFEVVTPERIFYADESGQYLIDGSLFDLNSRRNLTETRSRQLFAIDFTKLPLELAVKKVKGKGSRKMAYFTDPNCGYCKKLEHELQSIQDVTLYVFLYPLFDGSADKARAEWCSNDKIKAWDDLMLNGIQPAAEKCEMQIEKIMALGKKLKINGTPALIFANGVINPGYLPAEELEKALANNK